jgi:hypothetical protein
MLMAYSILRYCISNISSKFTLNFMTLDIYFVLLTQSTPIDFMSRLLFITTNKTKQLDEKFN